MFDRIESRCALLAGIAVASIAATASAGTTIPITVYNNASGASLSGLNVTVDLADAGTYSVFSIVNSSSGVNLGAVVTSFYVESTSFSTGFLGAASLVTPFAPGVAYSVGSSPPNPGGGISPSWGGNKFSASPDSPGIANGVGSGEFVSFKMNYTNGMTYAALVSQLTSQSPPFRIAMHIQSVGENANSVWGVTVPSPGAAALFGLAVIVGGRRRR